MLFIENTHWGTKHSLHVTTSQSFWCNKQLSFSFPFTLVLIAQLKWWLWGYGVNRTWEKYDVNPRFGPFAHHRHILPLLPGLFQLDEKSFSVHKSPCIYFIFILGGYLLIPEECFHRYVCTIHTKDHHRFSMPIYYYCINIFYGRSVILNDKAQILLV